jgi:1-acyl-sn-glycerol-3-phosphate acyltransferase
VRLFLFAVSALSVAVGCTIYNALGADSANFRLRYYRILNRLIDVKVVVVRGEQSASRPRLVVANHISYFDITVLGALVPGEFVARGDLAGWPFFGFIAKAANVVFVDRKRTATSAARDQVQERLDAGDTLIMFPESTSGDGTYMKPLKSALFSVAERHAMGADGVEREVTVQPVSIAYTRLNGLPLGLGWRSFIAWYGNMELPAHLWMVAKLGTVTAEVIFHPPVVSKQFPDRKALAAHCDRVIRTGFAQLLAGRAST